MAPLVRFYRPSERLPTGWRSPGLRCASVGKCHSLQPGREELLWQRHSIPAACASWPTT